MKGFKGKHHSEESRDKIRLSLKGRKQSPAHVKNMISSRGRTSSETKEKLRQRQLAHWFKVNGFNGKNGWVLHQKRLKQNGGSHTEGEWENLKAQYNWICLSCQKREPEVVLTKDHIIPVSKGGSDNIENIQPLCRSCNSAKHTQEIKYKIN